jgi:hypothetical protein
MSARGSHLRSGPLVGDCGCTLVRLKKLSSRRGKLGISSCGHWRRQNCSPIQIPSHSFPPPISLPPPPHLRSPPRPGSSPVSNRHPRLLGIYAAHLADVVLGEERLHHPSHFPSPLPLRPRRSRFLISPVWSLGLQISRHPRLPLAPCQWRWPVLPMMALYPGFG